MQPMYIVVTEGFPPYAHAIFHAEAEAWEWIFARGMQSIAWVERI